MKGGIIGLSGGVLAILALSSAQAAEPTVHPDRNNIAALLDAPAQWEFVDTPFHDIIKYLKVHDKIVVQIDNKAIGDRLSVEMEITFNVKLIPLKSALHILLGDLGLAYIVDGDALLITTAEAAAKQRSAVTYPINDILKLQGQSRKSPNSSAACKALIKAITATIDPQSWTPADPASRDY